jgi:hypothetical protein
MAMVASVTVSMLALTTGTRNRIVGVSQPEVSTSCREANGDRLGTNKTSSKVKPLVGRIFIVCFLSSRQKLKLAFIVLYLSL